MPLALASAIALSQQLIRRSVFEWGKVREFYGVLKANPVPHLVVADGATNQSYYLVRPWKFGFDPALAAKFHGQPVSLRGSLIYRDDQAMIEVQRGPVTLEGRVPQSEGRVPRVPDTTESMGAHGVRPSNEVVSLGEQTFVGEIVDSKCFFGVMNPGQLKPHRACAVAPSRPGQSENSCG